MAYFDCLKLSSSMSRHLVVHCCKFHLSSALKNTASFPKQASRTGPHPYRILFPWKTLPEFSSHILNSLVYNEGGLIALNKPYGVKIYKNRRGNEATPSKNARYATLMAAQEDFRYSIEETLPDLKKLLNFPHLSIIKSVERYSSGLVLLAANDVVKNCVIKSFNRAKNMKKLHSIYWAVTRGVPVVPMREERVAVKLIDVEVRDEKQPIVLTQFSNNDVKRKRVTPFLVEYRILDQNPKLSCSLIEIAVSSTRYHFLRVYATSRAASILGDPLYGSRANSLLGFPTVINPNNLVAYDVQPLPAPMGKKLNLPPTVEGHLSVPTMLHLQKIFLPNYQKREDLYITAPPLPHFQWTCNELGLSY